MFACNGILFNHESPIRGETFVTRKITRAAARIALGLQDELFIGNLDARRDWGHAKDYVAAQWLMLQQTEPKDYVIATGRQHTVRQFCEYAFAEVGIRLTWKGEGINETGVVNNIIKSPLLKSQDRRNKMRTVKPGKKIVFVDSRYFRPTEVDNLLGDPTKANKDLGWQPKIEFSEMIHDMVKQDLIEALREQLCMQSGFHMAESAEARM
jgi:GDPmannose 4,6-dehydratase